MVTVKITETYDLKTTVGKLGLVAVHTPTVVLLRKLYPGLLKNHRFVRFVKADVTGACASVLPADPLQVGVGAGEVAPEDMFNPILYTACSNTSFDTIMARIYALTDVAVLNSVAAGDAFSASAADAHFNAYYSLLAEHGKFRKVMPQNGFDIRGLVPLCHTIISTYGNVGPQGNVQVLAADGESEVSVPDMSVPRLNGAWGSSPGSSVYLRGKAVKMPKFPIHTGPSLEGATDIPIPNLPKTMVLLMCLPPAKQHEFYYRMRVTWHVSFEGVCSSLEAGSFNVFQDIGASSHATGYSYESAKTDMQSDADMVSSDDVDIKKIMES